MFRLFFLCLSLKAFPRLTIMVLFPEHHVCRFLPLRDAREPVAF